MKLFGYIALTAAVLAAIILPLLLRKRFSGPARHSSDKEQTK